MKLLRTVPLAGWICAAVAILNAVCWSVITPPFQVPDEPPHVAYVRQLAEHHRLPSSSGTEYSHEEEIALGDLQQGSVSLLPPHRDDLLAGPAAKAGKQPRHGGSPPARRQ